MERPRLRESVQPHLLDGPLVVMRALHQLRMRAVLMPTLMRSNSKRARNQWEPPSARHIHQLLSVSRALMVLPGDRIHPLLRVNHWEDRLLLPPQLLLLPLAVTVQRRRHQLEQLPAGPQHLQPAVPGLAVSQDPVVKLRQELLNLHPGRQADQHLSHHLPHRLQRLHAPNTRHPQRHVMARLILVENRRRQHPEPHLHGLRRHHDPHNLTQRRPHPRHHHRIRGQARGAGDDHPVRRGPARDQRHQAPRHPTQASAAVKALLTVRHLSPQGPAGLPAAL
jgi:hypothetical protein